MLEGGSKLRFLPFLVRNAAEVVYGGPFCGGAAVALSVLGRDAGIRTTLFYAKRKALHRRQLRALRNGAVIYQVPHGYMTNVQAKARAYAASAGALMLPLGFDIPEAAEPFGEAIAAVRRRMGDPEEVWCATGSGMLVRLLGRGFPNSKVIGVAVGLKSRHDAQWLTPNVTMLEAPEDFAKESKITSPFPCCPNYDRKAWAMAQERARGSTLFWNVMGAD